jgi:hypothetical protein
MISRKAPTAVFSTPTKTAAETILRTQLRQLKRFRHLIRPDKVFGTHTIRLRFSPGNIASRMAVKSSTKMSLRYGGAATRSEQTQPFCQVTEANGHPKCATDFLCNRETMRTKGQNISK